MGGMARIGPVAKRLGVPEIADAGCSGYGVGFRTKPLHFSARASAPKRVKSAMVVPRSVVSGPTPVLVAAIRGPVVMVKSKKQVWAQT